jgi:hypothetical protein
LAVAALAGCGSADGDDDSDSRRGLIERVPTETAELDSVAFLDAVAMREALGLADDAGFERDFEDLESPEVTFAAVLGSALPHLNRPGERPMSAALDTTQISAVASTFALFAPESVTVVATEQPYESIASELEAQGYRGQGEALVSDQPPGRFIYPAVASGDGIVAMGGSAKAVLAAAAGSGEVPASAARELIDGTEAPFVAAHTAGVPDCLKAVGASVSGEGSSELILLAEDDAAAQRLTIASDRFGIGYDFGEPAVDGERLTVAVGAGESGLIGPAAVGLMHGDSSLYDCRA